MVLVLTDAAGQRVYPEGQKPTSEWHCHRLLQESLLGVQNPDRVVLHAHPASLILLSQQEIYNNPDKLNDALSDSLSELRLYLPEGVAAAPAAPPGSLQLAEESVRAIGKRKALIWQGHGIVCLGQTPDQALDFMEVVEKAAQLALFKIILTNFKV